MSNVSHWSMDSSAVTVGVELATRVAQSLEAGKVLAYQHRDYCGIGLRFSEGRFIYGEVNDGLLPSDSEAKYWQAASDIERQSERQSFLSRTAFVAWLAAQSDESLSGSQLEQEWLRRNQRITIARLESFVSACQA